MKGPRDKAVAVGANHDDQTRVSSPVGRNERALEVVKAAYSLIAEKGFEGLRTREVAANVGINSATLHYYFPTKEDLIQAVVEHLMQELQTSRVAIDKELTAKERLWAEFSDIRARLRDSPEQLIVLTELAVRSWRDPAVANILKYLDEGWRGHLMSILHQGIDEGEFRSELDVSSTAATIMIQLRAVAYQAKLDPPTLDRIVEHLAIQTEHWVLKLPKSKRQKPGASASPSRTRMPEERA